MRFAESKRRYPWLLLIVLGIVLVVFLVLGFCEFKPTVKTVQKTIVFEAD